MPEREPTGIPAIGSQFQTRYGRITIEAIFANSRLAEACGYIGCSDQCDKPYDLWANPRIGNTRNINDEWDWHWAIVIKDEKEGGKR